MSTITLTPEYQAIAAHYGEHRAKRSGVRFMWLTRLAVSDDDYQRLVKVCNGVNNER